MGIHGIRFKRAGQLGVASSTIPLCGSFTQKKKKMVTKLTLGLYSTHITLVITCHFEFTKYILFYNTFIFTGKLRIVQKLPKICFIDLSVINVYHKIFVFPSLAVIYTYIYYLYYLLKVARISCTQHDPLLLSTLVCIF